MCIFRLSPLNRLSEGLVACRIKREAVVATPSADAVAATERLRVRRYERRPSRGDARLSDGRPNACERSKFTAATLALSIWPLTEYSDSRTDARYVHWSQSGLLNNRNGPKRDLKQREKELLIVI